MTETVLLRNDTGAEHTAKGIRVEIIASRRAGKMYTSTSLKGQGRSLDPVVIEMTEAEQSEREAYEVASEAKPKTHAIPYEEFQDRFTTAEFDAATDFVYESDLETGKPKRRALIQGLSRYVARNSVDLLGAETLGFLDALIESGIITEIRKDIILDPVQ